MTQDQEREAFEAVCRDDARFPPVDFSIDDAYVALKEVAWRAWQARAAIAQRAAPAAVPAGFVLVPVEPTQAMLDAVVTSMDDHLLGAAAEQKYREDWDAMLAAAPAAPQPAQADQATAPGADPVAVRYDFDGYGWKYIDNGSGSDWMTRHPDGELLYDGPCAAVGAEPTYSSTQATKCARCGEHKHTPLRIDAMGGYVCLTCIDKKLGSLLGEFGYEDDPQHKDAERYRWLRGDDSHGFGAPRWSRWQVQVWGGDPLHWQNVAGEALDAEVDAAIASHVPVQGSGS